VFLKRLLLPSLGPISEPREAVRLEKGFAKYFPEDYLLSEEAKCCGADLAVLADGEKEIC
jgi:hypothetical protein